MRTIARRARAVLLAALLVSSAAAAPSPAATMFDVRSPEGGLSRASGPVERYTVSGPASTPVAGGTIDDSSFYQPDGLAFGPGGELFVINRGDTIPQPSPSPSHGSITRFLNPTGTPAQNGVIESSHFDLPSLGQFKGNELFVAQAFGTNVVRFNVTSSSATFNGAISAGLCCQAPRVAAFSPSGELFVTQCCGVDDIHRYVFDSSGNAIANGVITGNGMKSPHDMAFSPSGELFVASADNNRISRFRFDSNGAAIANGVVTTSTLQRPIGLDFSPRGELFVADFETRDVSRFVFDRDGGAIPNGTFQTPAAHIDLQFAPQAAPPSLPAIVMADQPVGYWRFGETSGTVAADSADGNDGTYLHGFFLRKAGVEGNDAAVQLDGADGYVQVPDSASLRTGDQFSLELWLKRRYLSSSNVTEGLFIKGYQVFLDLGKVVLRKPNVDRIAESTTAITDSSYHHVVVTKSGSQAHIYIDGQDRTGPVSNRTITDSGRPLGIGTGAAQTFRGFLDEVAIYNHALTAQQVLAHFNAGR